jgi:hypothetical protein
MNYFVKRGDKEYGPYSLALLQQYVQQGNISQQDLARSEALTDWVPVSSLLGNVQVSPPTGFGNPQMGVLAVDRPKPPGLHWGIVVVLGIVTLGIFWIIWLFVEAVWIRKVKPESQALYFLIGYVGCAFAAGVFEKSTFGPGILLQLVAFVLYLVGIFKMRSDIEDYYDTINPVGISLSGAMTFFFNAAYFQYHLRDMREESEMSMAAAAGHH